MSKIHKALQRAEQEAQTGGVRPLTPIVPPLVVESPRPHAERARAPHLDDASFSLAAFTPEARPYLDVPPAVAQEFYGLQNRLEIQPAAARPRSILVTSALPGEGCSVVSLGMATCFVRRGESRSVLLVDGDVRSPNLDGFFQLDGRAGLVEVLDGSAPAEEAIHATEEERLYFLGGGRRNGHPSQLDLVQDGPRLRGLSAFLKGHFEYVIVDASPVLTNADVAVLASAVDGVVLVVKAHKTRRHVVQEAKKLLENSGAKLIGVVLNRRKFPIPGWLYRSI